MADTNQTGPPPLSQRLTAISETILSPRFPQGKEEAEQTNNELSDILTAISEKGLVGKHYAAIMDLALSLTTQKAGTEGTRKHFQTIGQFFSDLKDKDVKGKQELFKGLMQKFLHFLNNVGDVTYLSLPFVEPVMTCLSQAMGQTEEQVRLWINMIRALLKHPIPACIQAAHGAMSQKDKVLIWKKYPEDIKKVFNLLRSITFPKWLTEKEHTSGMNSLRNLTGIFMNEAGKAGFSKLGLTGPMVQFVFHCAETHNKIAYGIAENVANNVAFNAKKDKKEIIEMIHRVISLLKDDSYDWDHADTKELCSAIRDLMINALLCIQDGKFFSWKEYDELIGLAKLCQARLLESADPYYTMFFDVSAEITDKTAEWLQTMNESHRLLPLVAGVMRMIESGDKEVRRRACIQAGTLSRVSGKLFASHLEKLIALFLDSEEEDVLMAIWNSYEHNPGPLAPHFDSLFAFIDSGNLPTRLYILQLLVKVAKHQPQLFDQKKVGVVVKEAKEEKVQQVQILMILVDIAKRCPDRFQPYIPEFMKPGNWQTYSAYFIYNIMQMCALRTQNNAERIVNHFMKRIHASHDHHEILFALHSCPLIAFKHRSAVEKHRPTIEKFMKVTTHSDLHKCCEAILDTLDGKSVDKMADQLKEMQGDVTDLDTKVTNTENTISEVKDTVHHQGDSLDSTKANVAKQGQRLNQTKEKADRAKAVAQELDDKTISHTPFWARDISHLLNKKADNDWRQLSRHLGYNNDDIKAWGQLADPCLALLNKWYSTNKTREATLTLLDSLQLLKREDAAIIVENAMKNAEAVVEDEEFEYATPPDVFLSYQWGHQDEVKLLRQHLEMAGFSCWMDIGQMGGGDKLFEKIDTGIRGAKVVISCVTTKYTKSPNCNREVNLSINLGKPVIPLLMEKTTWPPPGSMGPIFSEYLFIRFFQRSGEETTDQRYWPLAKFQELLMQLAVIGVKADHTVVQPEYKDWWIPKVKEATGDVKQNSRKTVSTADKKAATSPDIFISYQWGKQPQVLQLYRALTSLGYSCWLDIMQMGGGDSLYDKIDKGLRGCQVVLSCITTKYTKSSNCQREVSLAESLQKPLIPLLLESITWPPPGPMSPVLTQLLYVNCTQDNLQDTWEGSKFDEILTMVDKYVPRPKVREREKEGKSGEGKQGATLESGLPVGLQTGMSGGKSSSKERETTAVVPQAAKSKAVPQTEREDSVKPEKQQATSASPQSEGPQAEVQATQPNANMTNRSRSEQSGDAGPRTEKYDAQNKSTTAPETGHHESSKPNCTSDKDSADLKNTKSPSPNGQERNNSSTSPQQPRKNETANNSTNLQYSSEKETDEGNSSNPQRPAGQETANKDNRDNRRQSQEGSLTSLLGHDDIHAGHQHLMVQQKFYKKSSCCVIS